mmetsp:Transcript_14436/g.23534  ORF Transcript_14436/g.23534 Transcript_14436/m.23534 type:complete len:264 (-) Transcript_14436:217-1008(-)
MPLSTPSCSSASVMTSTIQKRTNNLKIRMNSPIFFLLVCCSCSCFSFTTTTAFTVPAASSSMVALSTSSSQITSRIASFQRTHHARSTALQNFKDDDDEDADLENYDPAIAAQIRKARKLLRDAKQKMEIEEKQQQNADESSTTTTTAALPFFAQQSFTATAIDHTQKIKSKTKSGDIIADGDTMTSLSNSEPWERRSLSDIGFESEARSDYDGNLIAADEDVKRKLAERDLAASIYNLRKVMQNEDFRRVFDARNRFIGEVD